MLQLLQRSVDVSPHKVRAFAVFQYSFLICRFLVWGVIWLIQAAIFFALGIIVGLVAFKVGTPVTPYFSIRLICT